MSAKPINDLSHELIGAAIEVHRELGPGLLESAYEGAYSHELTLRQIPHVRQKLMPVTYKGVQIDTGYRIDILAEERVVVELKAVEKLIPIYSAQLMTYLRLGKYPLGLLMNFNVLKLVDGIERVSNNAPNLSASSAPSALKS